MTFDLDQSFLTCYLYVALNHYSSYKLFFDYRFHLWSSSLSDHQDCTSFMAMSLSWETAIRALSFNKVSASVSNFTDSIACCIWVIKITSLLFLGRNPIGTRKGSGNPCCGLYAQAVCRQLEPGYSRVRAW